MTMKYKVIRECDYITTRWSGGTTSQIMIWPENAVFSQRRFQWRISKATVEDGESKFTRMDGFHRELYMMTGKTVLHFPEEEKCMEPGKIIHFNGESEIWSVGCGTDLNLIMKNGVDGCMEEKEFNHTLFNDIYVHENIEKYGLEIAIQNYNYPYYELFINYLVENYSLEDVIEVVTKHQTVEETFGKNFEELQQE